MRFVLRWAFELGENIGWETWFVPDYYDCGKIIGAAGVELGPAEEGGRESSILVAKK